MIKMAPVLTGEKRVKRAPRALFPRFCPRQKRRRFGHFAAPSKLGPIRTGPGKMISNRFEYFQIDLFYTLPGGLPWIFGIRTSSPPGEEQKAAASPRRACFDNISDLANVFLKSLFR